MCGICGIAIPRRVDRAVDRATLIKMRDSLVHRGPDDAGAFISGGVALGHRRLSIVDVAGGHQPMTNENGTVWLAFNGEIYNHRDFRTELESAGHVYHTSSDTETIIHLYEEHGTAAIWHLRGMFALAIWDGERNELVLARDRLGVKPLYYVLREDGSIWFASEIKALIAAGAVKPELNHDALPDYCANRGTSGEQTLFRGIKRLMPGHTLIWKEGRVKIDRYWDLRFERDEDSASEREYIERFRELFYESVKLRLMSDVPLGMFLSGGIDSTAIAAAMAEMVREPIKTFSVAFDEREANELEYARIAASAFGTDHHEVVVSPEDFFQSLPGLVYHEDEPIAHPSSVPLYFVSRLASHHVKVVLTGEGSDELLGGYARYRKTLYNLAAGRAYHALLPSSLRERIKRALERMSSQSALRQKLSRTFLCLEPRIDSIYLDNFSVFSRQMQRSLFSARALEEIRTPDPYREIRRAMADSGARSLLNQLLAGDLKTYLHELLMKQDQMSMAASIESRVPFLDHKLVEFAAKLPERMKLRGLTTKYILRKAMADRIPRPILDRRKMGFPVPIGAWLRGQSSRFLDEYVLSDRAAERGIFRREFVSEIVSRHRAGENHSERLWSLINFEIWQRQFIDGESFTFFEPRLRAAITASA